MNAAASYLHPSSCGIAWRVRIWVFRCSWFWVSECGSCKSMRVRGPTHRLRAPQATLRPAMRPERMKIPGAISQRVVGRFENGGRHGKERAKPSPYRPNMCAASNHLPRYPLVSPPRTRPSAEITTPPKARDFSFRAIGRPCKSCSWENFSIFFRLHGLSGARRARGSDRARPVTRDGRRHAGPAGNATRG